MGQHCSIHQGTGMHVPSCTSKHVKILTFLQRYAKATGRSLSGLFPLCESLEGDSRSLPFQNSAIIWNFIGLSACFNLAHSQMFWEHLSAKNSRQGKTASNHLWYYSGPHLKRTHRYRCKSKQGNLLGLTKGCSKCKTWNLDTVRLHMNFTTAHWIIEC